MSINSNFKLKILYVMKILLEQTDELHPMTVNELIQELCKYDISAERKSIYTDIELLQSFGVDIVCEKSRTNNYFVASREFELPELKLLVDSVQASKFITHKKSDELINKLEKLASIHDAKTLHRQVIVQDRIKNMNESIYYNVDTLHNAIQQNRMVQFKYFEYTIDKKLKFKRNGELYCVIPYALTWADDNYYLIAYHQRYNDISHFRVDRMADIEISSEDRLEIEKFKDFNVAEYSKKVFRMFSGETETIELEFSNSLINVIFDRFGKEIHVQRKTEKIAMVSIEVAATNTFFGWLLMFGDQVKIVSPIALRDKMKEYLIRVLDSYS